MKSLVSCTLKSISKVALSLKDTEKFQYIGMGGLGKSRGTGTRADNNNNYSDNDFVAPGLGGMGYSRRLYKKTILNYKFIKD